MLTKCVFRAAETKLNSIDMLSVPETPTRSKDGLDDDGRRLPCAEGLILAPKNVLRS